MRVSMPPIILLLFFFIVAFLSNCSVQERTRKASKGTLEQIKQLFSEKAAHRAFVQNDPRLLADEPHGLGGLRRNPAARRHHNELAVNDPDGDYLQGDMELAEWQAERLRHKLNASPKWRRRRKRKIGRNLSTSVGTDDDRSATTWQKMCQKRRDRKYGTHWPFGRMRLVSDSGKAGQWTLIGLSSSTEAAARGISITTPGCDFVGIIAHEVGHALGTFHEQARPDQPRHIAVHYSNIPAVRWNNFQPIGDDQAATFGLPYDAGSVMHYGPYGFAADHFRPTISTLDTNWFFTIGQREGPSFLDIDAINRAYGCADHCPRKLNCQHGGYTDPNDCERCVCPTGVSGTLCTEVQPSPCGAAIMVSSTAQNISSPEFPNNFPAASGCVWLLRSPPQGHVLVEFVEEPFGYPCEDTCDKAFVELKTGPDFRVTGYRFCCSTPPSMAFRSVGEEALLIHFGGGQAGHRGFRARVWSDRQWPSTEESVGGRATTTDSEWGKAMVSEVSGEEILSTTTMAPISGPETTASPVTNSSPVPMPFSPPPPSSTIDLTNSSPVPMPFSPPPPSSSIDLTNSSPLASSSNGDDNVHFQPLLMRIRCSISDLCLNQSLHKDYTLNSKNLANFRCRGVRLDCVELLHKLSFCCAGCSFSDAHLSLQHFKGKVRLQVTSRRGWKPSFGVSTVLQSIILLLYACDPHNSLVPSIGEQYLQQPEEFSRIARTWTERFAQ
uniref:Metalloendopeptidase n=1 Tax=Globodera pallida TaxID=36090 RepID=A0A183BHI2_GLOPA